MGENRMINPNGARILGQDRDVANQISLNLYLACVPAVASSAPFDAAPAEIAARAEAVARAAMARIKVEVRG